MKPLEVVVGQPHAGLGQEQPGVSRVKSQVAGAELQEPPLEAQLRQRQSGWFAAGHDHHGAGAEVVDQPLEHGHRAG